MKRIIILLLVCLTAFSLSAVDYVIDDALLLSESEKSSLETLLSSISEETGISTVVATALSNGGLGDTEYADRIIERSEYGEDGVVFFLNMGSRTYYISTQGYAMYVLDDRALANDSAYYNYLRNGEYYKAFTNWAKSVETYAGYSSRSDYAQTTLSSDGYWVTQTETVEKKFDWGIPLFFSLAIGAFISFFVISSQKKKLKNTGLVNNADDYVVPDSFALTVQKDIFLYSNIVRIPRSRPSDNNRGGGMRHTTTHISSSGRSHGGRGGSF